MEKFDWTKQEAAAPSADRDNNVVFDIPAGGYIMEIVGAEERTAASGNKYLVLTLDVAEGEYKGFAEKAEQTTGKDWSYKQLRVFYHTERTKAAFKRLLDCLEESNRRFKIANWQKNCDERDFKGLLIGVVCDEELNDYNGYKKRVTPNYFKIYNIDDIEDGKFQKPRMLTAEEKAKLEYNSPLDSTVVDDESIPF